MQEVLDVDDQSIVNVDDGPSTPEVALPLYRDRYIRMDYSCR